MKCLQALCCAPNRRPFTHPNLSVQPKMFFPKEELPSEKITGKGASSTRANLSCTCERLPAAEVCFEARTIDLPTWNVFRDFLNLAARQTLRRRIIRSTFPENSLWISPGRP